VTVLVTGSSGHLGEALMRTLQAQRREAIGIDILPGEFTQHIGSIADRAFVRRCMKGVTTVLHAATLHKPHVATHGRQDFVDVNVTGTLNLLEEAAAAGVRAFVYTSTTSVFGDALVPPPGEPAAWITEDVTAVPKNIYGVTKAAAEDLCQLFARNHSLRAIVLRTSRFFPEEDDNRAVREAYTDTNINCNSNTDSDHSVLFGNEPALRLHCFYPAYNVRYQRALWSQSGNCPHKLFYGEQHPARFLYPIEQQYDDQVPLQHHAGSAGPQHYACSRWRF